MQNSSFLKNRSDIPTLENVSVHSAGGEKLILYSDSLLEQIKVFPEERPEDPDLLPGERFLLVLLRNAAMFQPLEELQDNGAPPRAPSSDSEEAGELWFLLQEPWSRGSKVRSPLIAGTDAGAGEGRCASSSLRNISSATFRF